MMLAQDVPVPARILGIRVEIIFALNVAQRVYDELGYELVITSGTEPEANHKPGSLHYSGAAVDLRTRHMAEADKKRAADLLRARLGAEFDVVLEQTHIHIEFQPKGKRK